MFKTRICDLNKCSILYITHVANSPVSHTCLIYVIILIFDYYLRKMYRRNKTDLFLRYNTYAN